MFYVDESDVLQQPCQRLVVVGEAVLASLSKVSNDDFHFVP